MNVLTQSTVKTTTFHTIELDSDEVNSALSNYGDLAAATRAGLFSPASATAEDIVAIEFRSDGTAAIVVAAVRIVLSGSNNSAS